MNLSRYKEAVSGFAALADWQDSAALCLYSKASDLEQQGAFIEAADVFLTISDFRDSSSRADAVFRKAFRYPEQQLIFRKKQFDIRKR